MREDLPMGVSRRRYKRKGTSGVVNYCGRLYFKARVTVAGRTYTVGCYQTAEEAGRAYDEATFLLSHHQVIPWYLRFNSELDFLDSSGERLRPAADVPILSEPVLKWWARTFDDPAERVTARAYYNSLKIPLERERVAFAPRRSARCKVVKGTRRGPYAPRLARVRAEQAALNPPTTYDI